MKQSGGGVSLAPWHPWSTGFLTSEIRKSIDRMRAWPDVERIVTLPDIHLAGETCNGTVVATRNRIYPAAIGADIGCGMTALPLTTSIAIQENAARLRAILQTWQHAIAILKTHSDQSETMPIPSDLSATSLQIAAEREGRYQLGTLGRGNHFLELQIDAQENYWLLVHSGSRAMGQAVTAFHEAKATSSKAAPVSLIADSELGHAYRNDLAWCRRYASANRKAILNRAIELLADLAPIDADITAGQETDHNHLETRDGLLVHRKGAQRVSEGEWGVIPGSMATPTFHVEGRGSEDALDSCSHGAGRRLSRTEANQKLTLRDVRRSLANVTHDENQVSKIIDEAPSVYRDIAAVMRAQRDLVKRTNELHPLLTLKGGR